MKGIINGSLVQFLYINCTKVDQKILDCSFDVKNIFLRQFLDVSRKMDMIHSKLNSCETAIRSYRTPWLVFLARILL